MILGKRDSHKTDPEIPLPDFPLEAFTNSRLQGTKDLKEPKELKFFLFHRTNMAKKNGI